MAIASIILLTRDGAAESAAQLAAHIAALSRQGALPACEVLRPQSVDSNSVSAAPADIDRQIAATLPRCQGDKVVVLEATAGYDLHEIARLWALLARWDLVVGRRPVSPTRRLGQRVLLFPRRILFGRLGHDPDCLFWAARREALADLSWPPGQHRLLVPLVAARGFRVGETRISAQHVPPAPLTLSTLLDYWNPLTLARAAWNCWLARRHSARPSHTLSVALTPHPPRPPRPLRSLANRAAGSQRRG